MTHVSTAYLKNDDSSDFFCENHTSVKNTQILGSFFTEGQFSQGPNFHSGPIFTEIFQGYCVTSVYS